MKNINNNSISFLVTLMILLLTLSSCDHRGGTKMQTKHTPKALDDKKSSYMVIDKKRGSSNILEDLYQELVNENKELAEIESSIYNLHDAKDDSTSAFYNYHTKNQAYFTSADFVMNEIHDSILKLKIKSLVANQLEKYEEMIAPHLNLIGEMKENQRKISDLHKILKILKTLPLIAKYQKENIPEINKLERFNKKQDSVILLLETLKKK